ncbi:metalloendopeptidase OMA1, mitochondrial-like isoform X2 [Lytechinus pictus]|uniref:metalloendopeptidase OMA1, mitochondrial-like isoform X2 n=1 Tax=Lytechinus pictus TaxID=7653 RepID=UPI0030B9E991
MMARYITGVYQSGGFSFSRVPHHSLISRLNLCLSTSPGRSAVLQPCTCTLNITDLKKARTISTWRSNTALECTRKHGFICGRLIHTSEKRPAPPVAVWLALKTLAKTAAIVTGRTLRNRWRDHPKHKHKTTSERIQENKTKIIAGILGMIGFGIGYYYYHIDYTPLTNRPRFILFNKTQFEKIVDEEYKMNGHIFVFTGILQATDNIEQLGTVLAHEMAHVVLNHSAEMASFFEFFDLFMIVVLTVLWAFLPNDGIALVATWFKQKVVELLLHMPYNRSLEIEADEVGLMLAAKSCIDVRECKAFWEAMDVAQISTGEPEPLEFLSTHPSHQRRADYIESLLPKAIKVRQYCNCPELPQRIPTQRAVIQKSIPALPAA